MKTSSPETALTVEPNTFIDEELKKVIEQQRFFEQNPGLEETAKAFLDNPVRLETLQMAADADAGCLDQCSPEERERRLRFHRLNGASITNGQYESPNGKRVDKTFWHNLGFFIDNEGTIYNVRATDADQVDGSGRQYVMVLMSGGTDDFYERMPQQHCVYPYTYDSDIARKKSGVFDLNRVDFLNKHKGASVTPSTGTGGFDPHVEGTDWVEDRNSIRKRDMDDGSSVVEMHVPARGTQSEEVVRLYTPADVLATVRMLEAGRKAQREVSRVIGRKKYPSLFTPEPKFVD